MKFISPLMLLGALANCYGQTVYNVEPATKGNRIDLTIANQGGPTPAEGVEVRAVQYPSKITLTSTVVAIGTVPPRGEKTASFTFDVARPTKPGDNSQDTLKFLITDKNGSVFEKSIIVKYTLPATYGLDQNFPNPFNPSTTIFYQIPTNSRVTLHVYNVLGQLVNTLVDEDRPAGFHEATFDASRLATGVYFYRMTAGKFVSIKKMLLMK